ncbi:hypothetical protein CO180_04300, partial [candidate division WWE3 bacterium CG_4_9_14_3_um_filter_41_6]
PYVTAYVGYPFGFLWLVVAGLVMVAINYAYTDVVMFTGSKTPLQLVGYGKVYFGKVGQTVGSLIILIGQWGAMLAYIIGIGSFLGILFETSEYAALFSVITIIVVMFATWKNITYMSAIENILLLGMIAVIGLIAVAAFPFIKPQNLHAMLPLPTIKNFFLPYGIVLGAMSGYAVIPEVVRTARRYMLTQRQLYLSVVVGTLVPFFVYVVFQYVVVGVSGNQTSIEAISGLVPYLDNGIIKLGALLGVFAMLSSFFTLSYVIKDTFEQDYHVTNIRAHLLSFAPPVLLFLVGVRSFLLALELVGVWLGTTSVIFILLLYRKATKTRKLTHI